MRQIGTIDKDEDAERFSDYLLTQKIENMVETPPGGGAWAVWVENDDLLERARAELERFRANPADPRYDAAKDAGKIRKQNAKAEQRRRKQHVDVRTRWAQPAQLVRPVTIVLAAISIVISVGGTKLGRLKDQPPGPIVKSLYAAPIDREGGELPDALRRGEVWRLVTPIVMHFGVLHLLFNMFVLLDLGSLIETRRGSLRFALLVLGTAIVSNVAEYYLPNPASPNPRFGGMSGVNYALFGYAWVKGRFQPRLDIGVSPQTTFIMVAWLILCILPDVIPGLRSGVANVAHLAGLLSGAAVAYLSYAVVRMRKNR